jgi:hypothetical protein
MGTAESREDFWCEADKEPEARHADWMAELHDDHPISELSLPGTHDTLALHGVAWAQCQSLPLAAQLALGCRYLDVRISQQPRYVPDFGFLLAAPLPGAELPIYHGHVYQQTTLREVLARVLFFLEVHPSEAVVMRMAWENVWRAETFSDDVAREVAYHGRERFWLETGVPTLGQCRGKVVVLRSFGLAPHAAREPFGLEWGAVALEDNWQVRAARLGRWAYPGSAVVLSRACPRYLDEGWDEGGWVGR